MPNHFLKKLLLSLKKEASQPENSLIILEKRKKTNKRNDNVSGILIFKKEAVKSTGSPEYCIEITSSRIFFIEYEYRRWNYTLRHFCELMSFLQPRLVNVFAKSMEMAYSDLFTYTGILDYPLVKEICQKNSYFPDSIINARGLVAYNVRTIEKSTVVDNEYFGQDVSLRTEIAEGDEDIDFLDTQLKFSFRLISSLTLFRNFEILKFKPDSDENTALLNHMHGICKDLYLSIVSTSLQASDGE